MMLPATHLDDANRIMTQLLTQKAPTTLEPSSIQTLRAAFDQLTQEASVTHTLRSTVAQLSADLLKLNSQIAWLKKQLFGRKSEKYVLPAEAGLFADLPAPAAPDVGDTSSSQQAGDSAAAELHTQTQTVTYERDVVAGAGASGGRGTKTCYFWSYVGDDEHPYILYDYQLSRGSTAPNRWFTDARSQPNYHGFLQCDAYAGYNDLFDTQQSGGWRMTHVGCWAHARRNWLFTGSPAGGKAAAALFSLISSAKRHHAEPLAYLTDLFTRLPATPVSQLPQFLPDVWQPRRI